MELTETLTLTMDKMQMFYLSVILLSGIQIQHVLASDCNIVSVTSPSASTLNVVWSNYTGASIYLLDLRVVNSTTITPVVLMQQAPRTQRLIHGLRPGQVYEVSLHVFQFYGVVCTDVKKNMTVPGTSQITFSKALSSTSIRLEWSSVIGADSYILFVEKSGSPPQTYSQTFTTLYGQMGSLTPSTVYNCSVYASNSAGRGDKSNTKAIMTLMQAPTGVALAITGISTARVTWNPVSTVLLYQVTVTNNNNPSNAMFIKTISTISMDIINLELCSTYTVGVSSVNIFLVPGEANNVSYTTSTISPVPTISSNYSCSRGIVTVTWDLVFRAKLYRVMAVDSTGASLNCTSASTSCQITKLKCGERYQVNVTAISDNCESTSSTSSFFETVPCAPADPHTILDCPSNMVIFSWQPTIDTLYYVAMAVDLTGISTECRTANNSCYFVDTECGQSYSYTVYAVSSGCNSEVSQPKFVQTSPCLPTNIKTGAECHADMLITTWDSAAGALFYAVEVRGNTDETYSCTSSNNSCAMTGVPCGEHLSVWIVASNDYCSTEKVLGDVAQTIPCTPSNVSASVKCSQDSARINWMMNISTIFYIAVVEDANGNLHRCNSIGTNCLIGGLRCGQKYTGSVVATNLMCNSTTSEKVTFNTAPCSPAIILKQYTCDNNTAVFSWTDPVGRLSFQAQVAGGGYSDSCQTTNTSCAFQNLPCGLDLNVTVHALGEQCNSIPSVSESFETVPCAPKNVSSTLVCFNHSALVSWVGSHSAVGYNVTATGQDGHTHHCQTNTTSCQLPFIHCDETYGIKVTPYSKTCAGNSSAVYSFRAGRCTPSNVTVSPACMGSTVSWSPVTGAEMFIATATADDGHTHTCSSNNSSSCTFTDLHCGETYAITVVTVDRGCRSEPSSAVQLRTVPCFPTNVSVMMNCANKTAVVAWYASRGAVQYSVTAHSSHSNVSCQTSGLSCSLDNLICGNRYIVHVVAMDDKCSSISSQALMFNSEPCLPSDLVVNFSREDHSALVSWSPSPVAETYQAVVMAVDGHVHTCNTTSRNCRVSELHCDQLYTVFVTASHENCSTKSNQNVTVNTGPCQPDGLWVTFHCNNQSAVLSWMPRHNIIHYYGRAQAENGDMLYCHSTDPTCVIQGLTYGTVYNFSVQASDGVFNSSFSDPVQRGAAPCPPDAVGVQLMPMKGGVQVAHFNWTNIIYSDDYLLRLTGNLLGDSQMQFDLTSYWTKMTYFEIVLPCGSSYVATVESRKAAWNSTQSVPLNGTTAPCPPSGVVYSGNSSVSTVSWNASVFATMYTVYTNSVTPNAQLCSTAGLSCSLANFTSTNLLIKASNAAGQSEERPITIVVTQDRRRRDVSEQMPKNGGLSAPVLLDVTQAMPTVIFVKWSPVDNASHYILVIRKQGSSSEPRELTVYGESINLTDLSPDSTYCFSVSATGGPESDPVCVQTGQGLPQ